MPKTRSVSSGESPKAARASGFPKPPASCRYLSTTSRKLISTQFISTRLYPNIGARCSVGYVDVEQIGLRGESEALEQFLRAMHGAKRLGARQGDARDVVQAGHFLARHPGPGGAARAAFTSI